VAIPNTTITSLFYARVYPSQPDSSSFSFKRKSFSIDLTAEASPCCRAAVMWSMCVCVCGGGVVGGGGGGGGRDRR
jgi:hypothetical protein